MKKFQVGKRSKDYIKGHQKRIYLTDGYRTRFVFSEDLVEICGLSRSQAHKIINGQQKLKPAYEELLKLKKLGSISGDDWKGWYIDGKTIVAPDGYRLTSNMLEQFSFMMGLVASMQADYKVLLSKNKALEEELKNRTEVRVYTNDLASPSRTIRLVKK